MREDLRQIIIGVLAKQGISWNSIHHDDTGDGLRLLLPPDQPAIRALGPFVNELDAALRAHRMRANDAARLRLRVVAHHGLAYFDGGVWAGDALVLAARLLDAEPLRQALKDNPDANLALIVSEAIHKDVIVDEYGPPAQAFWPVRVSVKETRAQAWVYVPGASAPASHHHGSSGPRRGLDFHQKIAIAGLVVAIVGIVAALLTNEIRCQIGLGDCKKSSSSQPGPMGSSPSPASTSGGRFETTGGVTHTWSDYMSGGGTAGPDIPKGARVLVSCKIPGLRLANGNAWWYRIAQPDWNNRFYASADAFYNNDQTAGPLGNTPFVDESVPNCGA